MLPLQALQTRRNQLLDALPNNQPVLLAAGRRHSRNYPENFWPYRADSSFLFLFGPAEPGAFAWLDPESRKVVMFLDPRTPTDALWHGAVPTFDDMRSKYGVDAVESVNTLPAFVKQHAADRKVLSLAIADYRTTAKLRELTGTPLNFDVASKVGAPELIQAIGKLRIVKTEAEVAEMRGTARVTHDAFVELMGATTVGATENELVARLGAAFARGGCTNAYGNILSVRGEVLHNDTYNNTLQDGDLLLVDAGAEGASGYCSDVTRTWPANGKYTGVAKDVYDTVLRAQEVGVNAVVKGARYRDIHLASARTLAEGLIDLGLLKGTADSCVEAGAHAVFFPHGLGHIIGLDVHDMEAFGDAMAYPPSRNRSDQFGLAYLRLDIDLQPGIAVTIEPGLYFVPAILRSEEFHAKYKDHVDFAKAETFLAMNDGRGFGGIRIEDDVVCTDGAPENLTASIPKTRVEVEATIGTLLAR